MSDFNLRQGDLLPVLTATVLQPDGTPSNIQGGTTARFRMTRRLGGGTNPGPVVNIDRAATIVDAPTGKVQYTWAGGDTDVPGVYDFEFVLLTPAGQLSVPNRDPKPTLVIAPA